MTKTLLVVLGYQQAEGTIRRHWPYYEKAGCDILGVGRVDRHVKWPFPRGERSFIGSIESGVDAYVLGDNLPKQFVNVLSQLLGSHLTLDYQDFCIVEHDSIFIRKLPVLDSPDVFYTTRAAGGSDEHFKGENCFHCPWRMSRKLAYDMLKYGERMLKANLVEHGFPDRFLGLMVDLYGIPWAPTHSFSVNLIDRPEYVAAARQAVTEGAYFIHGIKTSQQLQSIIE